MMRMGRKSIAEKLLEGLPKSDSFDKTFLVLYDFTKGKATGDFYNNLERITEATEDGASLVQYSAYRTTSMKAAIAVGQLAARYGAKTALYEITETSTDELTEILKAAQTEVKTEPEGHHPRHNLILRPNRVA